MTNDSEKLLTLLKRSAAFKSIREERRICELLQHAGWRAYHSYYYLDLITNKPREIDVLASRFWSRKSRSIEQFVRVILLLEAKSIKDYHLIFSSSEEDSFRGPRLGAHRIWPGDLERYADLLTAKLKSVGTPNDTIIKLLDEFEKISYPGNGHFAIEKLIPDLYPAPAVCTAFRETNIASEKEIDNSVLWRASLALKSAFEADRSAFVEGRLSYVAKLVKWALEDQDLNIDEALDDYTTASANWLDIVHPIVAVNCALWLLKDDGLESIPWCRFVQVGTTDSNIWWFDIVQTSTLNSYFSELTKHYDSVYRRARARLIS